MKRSSVLPILSVIFEILALGAAALVVMALVTVEARAGALPSDTAVRVVGSGIEPGWFEGRSSSPDEGCTMVKLARPTKDKYTMLALVAVASIEKKEGAGWKASVARCAEGARSRKRCLKEGAD